jgi:O-antigen ligase
MIEDTGAASEMQGAFIPTCDAVYLDSRYKARILIWRKCVLCMVGAYLILNAGFEMVRIPPTGAGIPIGEWTLILSLCILNPLTILPKMSRQVWLFPILLWWLFSLPRCLFDTAVGGVWSFRDASQAIESLYLIVGFGLVNSIDNLRYFLSWLRRLLPMMALYGLFLPFSKILQTLSPKLPGLGVGSSGLLFQMTNTSAMVLWAAAWMMLERKPSLRGIPWTDLLAAFLIAYVAGFGQGRTTYIQILQLGVLFFFLKRKAAVRWYAVLALGCLLIVGITSTGLSLKGRTGNEISLRFILKHLESSSGSGDEGTQNAAEGVEQRLGWWRQIYAEMAQSASNEVFGLGYGVALTDFHNSVGQVVREPHNSFISVWARLGLTGAAAWLFMQVGLFDAWRRSYRLAKHSGWIDAQNNLVLLFLFFFLTLVSALAEDALEKPFFAIPYYFFFGVVLRYGMLLRDHAELQH